MSWLHRYAPRATPWRDKRKQRLEIDKHKCRTCGHDGSTWQLEIHHISYERYGDEDVEKDLITLCSSCHKAITESIRRRVYADRYIGLEFEDLVPTVTTRIEVNYGMANFELSVDFIGSDVASQRSDRKPTEQVGKGDEGGVGKEGENGC